MTGAEREGGAATGFDSREMEAHRAPERVGSLRGGAEMPCKGHKSACPVFADRSGAGHRTR